MNKSLFTLIFALLSSMLAAQGWERVYYGLSNDAANALAITPDGGYVMTGYYGGNRVHLLKTDVDGHLQWSKPIAGNNLSIGNDIVVTRDTGYAITGFVNLPIGGGQFNRNVLLTKTDAYGNVLWSQNYGDQYDDEGFALTELPDGGFLICGTQQNINSVEDVLLIRVDEMGNLVWTKHFGDPNLVEKGNSMVLAANGDIFIAGERWTNVPPQKDAYILRLDSDGNLIWENTYGLLNNSDEVARSIVNTNNGSVVIVGPTSSVQGGGAFIMQIAGDGDSILQWYRTFPEVDFYGIANDLSNGFFISGYKNVTAAQTDLYILHADFHGDKFWDAIVGKGGPDYAWDVVATADGGCAAAGATQPFIAPLGEENPYLVKTDADGVVFTGRIKGNVFLDANSNCIQDPNENFLPNWIVKITSPDFLRYAVADQFGEFEIVADTGSYQLQLIAPNDYWQTCGTALTFEIPDFYDTATVAIPVRPAISCPRNEVDVAAPILRRCTENTYTVQYCNSGTVASSNTTVEVELDPALSLVSSSIPVINQTGQTYTFAIGTLNAGECKSFKFNAFLDCNTIAGQTHCVTAHIYPDSFCSVGPGWDGTWISTRATCENDTVKLGIVRQGPAGAGPVIVDYVIAEDIIMLTDPNQPFEATLDANKDTTVFTMPANGKTYRIIASQIAGYPGVSYPTAAVEGCASNGGSFSTGFYTMFPEDDADAFVAKDCQESYETDYSTIFLKRGHPKGYDQSHYISPETDLDYLIFFKNSGTDTVHQVIVRDTLSAVLDPGSVFPGAASHVYDFQVYGNGIVEFVILNANLLPDGSSNNEGFVSFRVSQKPDISCGTEILNTAAVYFDFNAPAVTNEVFHTRCERDSFLIVETTHIDIPGADIKVYPNPFAESVTFEISGVTGSNFQLEIYDLSGRRVLRNSYAEPTFRLYKNQLPSGALFYRLLSNGKPLASGKIITYD